MVVRENHGIIDDEKQKNFVRMLFSFFSSRNVLQVERCSALLDTQFPKETILIFSRTEKAN